MKRLFNLTFLLAILLSSAQLFGQQWERTYSDGNNNGIRFRAVRQTSDGGYVYFGNYHRLLSKRFPFAVYYRIEGQIALVYAVLDCRRKPAWIRKKLYK